MQPRDTTIRRSTRLYLSIAAVVSCALALLLSLAPAYGQKAPSERRNVVTFGTQTASATKPDNRGIYLFGSTPGGRIEDHVAILNYSDQTATFLIRGTDGINTPQGGFAARPIDERSHDLGTWILLPKSDLQLTLRPRSVLIIPFLIEVPANATPGDHIGVITATLVSSVISKSGERVRLLQTVGTRIFLRVSGRLRPSLTITGLAVHYQGTLDPIGTGQARVTYTVSNTGNVALGGLQTVYVSGLFGSRSTATGVPRLQLLLPGYSVKEAVEVTGIFPEIRETAHVSIQPLYIAGSVASSSGPFQASRSFWAIPWTLIAIIVAAILIALGWFYRRRRRRGRGSAADSDKPGEGDDTGKQESQSGDAPASGRVAKRQVVGRESAAKDPTPVAPAEREKE
jgi:hypothetical protein